MLQEFLNREQNTENAITSHFKFATIDKSFNVTEFEYDDATFFVVESNICVEFVESEFIAFVAAFDNMRDAVRDASSRLI